MARFKAFWWVLCALFYVLVIKNFATAAPNMLFESFYGEVIADELLYLAVHVPRFAQSVAINIWSEVSLTSDAKILLRYDALPTLEEFDAEYTIPQLPEALTILDKQPTQSVLYMAIYGGVELHSYRYFAGSPSYTLIGVETKIDSCQTELEIGPDCELIEMLPISNIGSSVAKHIDLEGDYAVFALTIPHNLEAAVVDISYQLPELKTLLCPSSGEVPNGSIVLTADFYLDQPNEDYNAGKERSTITFADLCGSGLEKEDVEEQTERIEQGSKGLDDQPYLKLAEKTEVRLSIVVQRPLSGIWKLRLLLSSCDNTQNTGATVEGKATSFSSSSSTATTTASTTTTTSPVAVSVPISITSAAFSCPAGSTTTGNAEWTAEGWSARVQCAGEIVGMDSSRSPLIASGYSTHTSSTTVIPPCTYSALDGSVAVGGGASGTVDNDGGMADDMSFVIFAATLRPNEQNSAVGGGFQLQLKVALPPELVDAFSPGQLDRHTFSALMDQENFLLSTRVGGLPADPRAYRIPLFPSSSAEQTAQQQLEVRRTRSLQSHLISHREGISIPNARSGEISILAEETSSTDQTYDYVNEYDADDDSVCSSSDETFANIRVAESANAFMLSTREAAHYDFASGYDASSPYRIYVWSLSRPVLPNLFASGAISSGNTIYFRVSRETARSPTPTEALFKGRRVSQTAVGAGEMNGVTASGPARSVLRSGHGGGGGDSDGSDFELPVQGSGRRLSPHAGSVDSHSSTLLVTLDLLLGPCAAGSCEHGTCYTKEGDVPASSCKCRYPWAGEACDEMPISDLFYFFQVGLLVASNAAMLPGIVYSYTMGLPAVTSALTLAATASSFYHLCDVDAYCLFGLSFESLQVLDVLFSTSCMAIVLMLYCPLPRGTHAALSLTAVGLLVAPVTNDPTSWVNIVLAVVGALSIVVCVCVCEHAETIRRALIGVMVVVCRGCASLGICPRQLCGGCLCGWLPAEVLAAAAGVAAPSVSATLAGPAIGSVGGGGAGKAHIAYNPLSAAALEEDDEDDDDDADAYDQDEGQKGVEKVHGKGEQGEGAAKVRGVGGHTRSFMTAPRFAASARSFFGMGATNMGSAHGRYDDSNNTNAGYGDDGNDTSDEDEDVRRARNEFEINRSLQELEMSVFSDSTPPFRRSSNSTGLESRAGAGEEADGSDFAQMDARRHRYLCTNKLSIKCICRSWRQISAIPVGIVCAVIGLVSFAVESRSNYYYVHSMWHAFIMLSSFFLVKGSFEFAQIMGHTVW